VWGCDTKNCPFFPVFASILALFHPTSFLLIFWIPFSQVCPPLPLSVLAFSSFLGYHFPSKPSELWIWISVYLLRVFGSNMSQDSSVSNVTSFLLGDQDLIPSRDKNFACYYHVQTSSGAHSETLQSWHIFRQTCILIALDLSTASRLCQYWIAKVPALRQSPVTPQSKL
jgi:amino acid permease